MASEFFVFIIFGGVATYEYWKSLEKADRDKAKKESKRLEKLLMMKKAHVELEDEVNELREHVLQLTREVSSLKSSNEKSWYGKKQPLLTLQNLTTKLELLIAEKATEREALLEEVRKDEEHLHQATPSS